MTEVRDQISASPGKGKAASTISTAMAVDRIRKMTDGIIEDVERAIEPTSEWARSWSGSGRANRKG
jgi:hypothetical protein